MKDGLENIEEVFKQAFDGFESNVDPSVWNNIQNSISSGSGSGSTPQVDPSAVASTVGKSLALKIVAGVVLVSAVATSAYFIPELFEDKGNVVTENLATENIVAEDVVAETLVEKTPTINTEFTKGENQTPEYAVQIEDDFSVENDNEVLENTTNQSENNKEITISNAESSETSTESETANNFNKTFVKPASKKLGQSVKPEIVEKLSVKINVDVIKGKVPLTVQFDAIGDGVQYYWDFSDDSDETNEESPIHMFQKEGTYRVKLTGIDNEGNRKKIILQLL
ncbi:MAG: PKD domain-containing protein [Flavobacteriales bacterium]|nr:PKD domain-containing protein [Flavobacteriales bacterium]